MLTESVSACGHTYKAGSPLPPVTSQISPSSQLTSFFYSSCSSFSILPLDFLKSPFHFLLQLLSNLFLCSFFFPFSLHLLVPSPHFCPPLLLLSPAFPPIAANVWSWMQGLGRDWFFRVECSGVCYFIFCRTFFFFCFLPNMCSKFGKACRVCQWLVAGHVRVRDLLFF